MNETLVFESYQPDMLYGKSSIWAEDWEEEAAIAKLNSCHGLLLPVPTKYISSKYKTVDLQLVSLNFMKSVSLAKYLQGKGLLSKLVDCHEDYWRNPKKIGCVDEWNAIKRALEEYSTVNGDCSGLSEPLYVRYCDGDTLSLFLQFFVLQLGFYSKFEPGCCYADLLTCLSTITYRREIYYATMSLFYVTSSYVWLFDNGYKAEDDASARFNTVRNVLTALTGFKSLSPTWIDILKLSKQERKEV